MDLVSHLSDQHLNFGYLLFISVTLVIHIFCFYHAMPQNLAALRISRSQTSNSYSLFLNFSKLLVLVYHYSRL